MEHVHKVRTIGIPLGGLEVLVTTSCDKPPTVKPHKVTGLSSFSCLIGFKVEFKSASMESFHRDPCDLPGCGHAVAHTVRARCSYSYRYGVGLTLGDYGVMVAGINEPDTFEEDILVTDCECCPDPPAPP